MPSKKTLKTSIKVIISLVLIILLVLVLIFPLIMSFIATRPHNSEVGKAPDGYEEVEIITEDSIKLAGWYKSPENGACVLLLHGAGNNRKDTKDLASMLTNEGFGVLSFDFRGHGESGGSANLFGWDSDKDIKAAVNYLATKEEVKIVGALGQSMGAEILLGSLSQNPEITAVVSDGATYRSYEDFKHIDTIPDTAKKLSTLRIQDKILKLISHSNPPESIFNVISKNQDTEFLFIAAGNDDEEVSFNRLYSNIKPERSEIWIAPDTNHIQAFSKHHDEYAKKVIDFFNTNLVVE